MCEIQLIKRIDNNNLSKENLIDFIKFMSLGDMGNPHAFGLFNSKGLFKHPGKFNYTKLNDLFIMSDKFVVGHNRYATNKYFFYDEEEDDLGIIGKNNPFFVVNANSGNYMDLIYFNVIDLFKNKGMRGYKSEIKKPKKIKEKIPFNSNINNHPFELGDFVMVHNGVVSNEYELKRKYKINTKITTDSYIIIWLIDKFFNESKLKNRRDKIVEAITKTTKEIKRGFSVILYDKISKEMFYFKDEHTTFVFRKIENRLLIGSTNIKNFKYVYGIKPRDNQFFIPKPGVIYLIENYPKELYTFHDFSKIKENKEMKGGKK